MKSCASGESEPYTSVLLCEELAFLLAGFQFAFVADWFWLGYFKLLIL